MEFKKEQAVETEQYFTDFWELVMGFCVCVCVWDRNKGVSTRKYHNFYLFLILKSHWINVEVAITVN